LSTTVSVSATVAIPGIPKFYKSNVQGTNKSISIIPNFLNGLYLDQDENSGESPVAITLLGIPRAEGRSVLLENVFQYGIPNTGSNAWFGESSFRPNSNFNSYGYCSILNTSKTVPAGSKQYLITDVRLRGNQIFAGRDIYLNANWNPGNLSAPFPQLTTFYENYIHPVIYHNKDESCVTLEGWLEPYITPWWNNFLGDYCQAFTETTPFDATLLFQTQRAFRYEPGKSMTFTMGIRTNTQSGTGAFLGSTVYSRASWGCRNETDTYQFVLEGENNFYVERKTPWGETSLRVYRKNFIDPLDGTGKSGLNIDFTKVTMYSIEFSWYGAVGANFFVYAPVGIGSSKWIKVASLLSSNIYTKPALSNPNMRLFTELYIPMGCGKPQLLSLYGSSVYMDGHFRDTLKFSNVESISKRIEQRDKTQLSLQLPNTLQGLADKPVNGAVVYPTKLTGIASQPATIDIYETNNQGGIDVNTAYYLAGTTLTTATTDTVKLDTDIKRNGTSFTIDTAPYTQQQKLNLMSRLATSTFIYRNPSDRWDSSIWSGAGTSRLSGAICHHPGIVAQLSSSNVSSKINIIVERAGSSGILPEFLCYQKATSYPVPPAPVLVPAIADGDTLFPAGSTFDIGTNIDNNSSFIMVDTAVKSGQISVDTDLLGFYGGGDKSRMMSTGFGFIDDATYNTLKAQNYFKDNVITLSTGVQIASASPKSELIANSQFAYYTSYGMGGSSPTDRDGWPKQPPFYVNGKWVIGGDGLPFTRGSFELDQATTVNPFARDIRNKLDVLTRFETTNFTLNADVRHHNFVFDCTGAAVQTTDATHTYIRASFTPAQLFSYADGILTNNLYNFKLLMYGHNALMRNMFYNRIAKPYNSNWSSNVKIMPFTLGIGTDFTLTDSEIDSYGSLIATLGFPTSATAAIAAFIAKPSFQIEFKTIFLRNVQYRSESTSWWQDRNTGLFHGTFFLDTIEPVHLFILMGSRTSYTNTPGQTILRSTSAIPRPVATNFQINGGRDRNDIPLENLKLSTFGVTRNTQLQSQDYGILTNLPETSFTFREIPGSNTQYDPNTTEFLNLQNKIKQYSFRVLANTPFEYDLSSIYNADRNMLTTSVPSILNRDYKRFFVTARTTKNESFGNWNFTNPIKKFIFETVGPFGEPDGTLFTVDSTSANTRYVYLQRRLPDTALSDRYYISSVYAKPGVPALSAGRYVIFSMNTGESNTDARGVNIFFDIIDNKIGFLECRGSGATSCQWFNRYNNQTRTNLYWPYIDNTRWFATTGYANLNNKFDRYVVAAHIQEAADGWKRLSTCIYFKNNHLYQTIFLGDITNNRITQGNIFLYGATEEMVSSDTTVDTASGWFPSAYVPAQKGYITTNLTIGEQQ